MVYPSMFSRKRMISVSQHNQSFCPSFQKKTVLSRFFRSRKAREYDILSDRSLWYMTAIKEEGKRMKWYPGQKNQEVSPREEMIRRISREAAA